MTTDEARLYPSSSRRGGRDIKKCRAASLYGADGVVIKFQNRIGLCLITTPSARAKDAMRLLIDRAATPPRRGAEMPNLTNSHTDVTVITDKSTKAGSGQCSSR